MVALVAAALAAEPDAPADGVVDPAEPGVIVVYGDLRVEQARQALIRDLREQGYTTEIDRGDYVILRNDLAWKGEVLVHDDGWVRMKRQPIRAQSPDLAYAPEGSALAWAHCLVMPFLCVKVGGQTVSRRRWLGTQDVTMEAIAEDTAAYADRVADRRVDDVIADVPGRLEALWLHGTPLGDGPVLTTVDARKAALLAYWESRTDTVWGDRVRMAIEAFIRGEVQRGDHPFTPQEIAAFNARRRCERDLDLARDWEAVLAAEGG